MAVGELFALEERQKRTEAMRGTSGLLWVGEPVMGAGAGAGGDDDGDHGSGTPSGGGRGGRGVSRSLSPQVSEESFELMAGAEAEKSVVLERGSD